MSDQSDIHSHANESECSSDVKSIISELVSLGVGDCVDSATECDLEIDAFAFADDLPHFKLVPIKNYDPDFETATYQLQHSNLDEKLSNILKLRIHSDLKIVLQGETIPCHRLTCSMFSRVLRECRTMNVVVIKEESLTADLFNKMYDWLVGHPIEFKRNELFPLYHMAKYFQIERIVRLCQYYFDSAYFNEMTSFLVIYELRFNPDLFDEIVEPMLHRINKIHLVIFTTEEFLKLGEKEIIAILSSDYAGVNSEIEILYAAILWLEYSWPDRFNAVERIFSCVRFGLISPGLLQVFCEIAAIPEEEEEIYEDCEDFEDYEDLDVWECIEDSEYSDNSSGSEYFMDSYTDDPIGHFSHVLVALSQCKKLMTIIEKSIMYSHYHITYGHNMSTLRQKVESQNLPVFKNRLWLTDPCCRYHRLPLAPNRPNLLYITFEEFIEYLNELSELDPQEFINRVKISKFLPQ